MPSAFLGRVVALPALAVLSLGCARGVPTEGARFALAPLPRGPDAVQARFVTEERREWELLDDGGRPLCALPCVAWLPPRPKGFALAVSGDSKQKPLDVPEELGTAPGEPVEVSVHGKSGHPGAMISLIATGLGLDLLGFMAYAPCLGTVRGDNNYAGCPIAAGVLIVGTVLAAAGVAFGLDAHGPGVDVRPLGAR
jgi:hypothetical protein